jgi:hypothetical protein
MTHDELQSVIMGENLRLIIQKPSETTGRPGKDVIGRLYAMKD